jgi:hypothetical protein
VRKSVACGGIDTGGLDPGLQPLDRSGRVLALAVAVGILARATILSSPGLTRAASRATFYTTPAWSTHPRARPATSNQPCMNYARTVRRLTPLINPPR